MADNESFEISLLIGADHYWDIVQDHIIRGNSPTAMQSKLGYLLSGRVTSTANTINSNYPTNMLNVLLSHVDEDDQIERFWNLESLGTTDKDSPVDEARFIREYQQTAISREQNGSYTAKFPWKKDHPPLPTNHIVCEKRTRATIKRINQMPDLLRKYGTIIKDQEEKGFIEKISSTASNYNSHYIPHLPVKKDSPTTPLRIDCSCKVTPNQASLNECLHSGPPLLNDMLAILLRVRTHKYGIVTNTEKASHHLNLHVEDRDFTRFLWLSDPTYPDSPFITYRFTAIPFGTTSFPFMLNAAIQYHLGHFNSPVSLDMKTNMYVDNVISGADTEKSAVNYHEGRTIINDAKFNLRSWASNCSALQNVAIQESTSHTSDEINTLGMRWNTS